MTRAEAFASALFFCGHEVGMIVGNWGSWGVFLPI